MFYKGTSIYLSIIIKWRIVCKPYSQPNLSKMTIVPSVYCHKITSSSFPSCFKSLIYHRKYATLPYTNFISHLIIIIQRKSFYQKKKRKETYVSSWTPFPIHPSPIVSWKYPIQLLICSLSTHVTNSSHLILCIFNLDHHQLYCSLHQNMSLTYV